MYHRVIFSNGIIQITGRIIRSSNVLTKSVVTRSVGLSLVKLVWCWTPLAIYLVYYISLCTRSVGNNRTDFAVSGVAKNIVFISECVLLNGELVHESSGESLTRV